MRVVLGVVARADNGSGPADRAAAVADAMRRAVLHIEWAFPSAPRFVQESHWRSLDGASALLTWHNEPADTAGFITTQSATSAVSLLGYVAERDVPKALDPTADLLTVTEDMSGCFAWFRSSGDRVEAVTDATRSNGVYVVESPRLRIVSSRALLAHMAERADTTGVDEPVRRMDLVGVRHMGIGGYFLADRTPFEGVRALDTAEKVTLDARSTVRRANPALCPATGSSAQADSAAMADDVAAALVAAFDPVPGAQLDLALTGGRDSRLLLAALKHRPDIAVSTVTTGMADDPDVVIAQQLAALLDLPHSAHLPTGVVDAETVRAEDPLSRIVRQLDVHDAMTSGWDDIRDYGPMRSTPAVSGVGGEILRGGLVFPEMDELDADVARTRLMTLLTGGRFFTETYNESALEIAAPLLELSHADVHRALDDFYYTHRNGRWVSARRAGARFRTLSYDPLLDNRFVRQVRAIPADIRWSERLAFDVIATLSPQIRDVPLEGRRWRFERHAPAAYASDNERDGWSRRAGVVRTASTATYSWQRLQDGAVRERVRELVLDNLVGPAAELFDRQALEEYLAPRFYAYPTTVWHITTAVVMLTVPWYRTLRLPRVAAFDIDLTHAADTPA